MVHLVIHLAYEAKVAGPVHYRWMYPIERFLFTLKSFVRNRAHPEGYVLFNNNNVDPFQREHIDLIKRQNRNRRLSPYEIDKIHSRTFSDWFRERVARLEEQ
ncbi:hypothetical protein QL285_052403 [Trifolium repens]|nr:hypothetical protein QL285_052403 [Trifolium repens]